MDAPVTLHPTDETLCAFGLGKLDDRSAQAVNEHLKACAECRQRVADIPADSFLGRVRSARKREDPSSASLPNVGGGTSAAPSRKDDRLPPGLAEHPDYTVVRELGRGGMGVVYLVRNRLMGRDEVLKVVGPEVMERPGVLDRFLREIRAVAKLRHPNIVAAHTVIRLGESLVFVMEYVEGIDLSKLVKAKGPLRVEHACGFIAQAAHGLQHAHEQGLVHRDIKPANLIVGRAGKRATVKVLDFGLAKAVREEQVDTGLTAAGQALGTPDYIAPEQILDAPLADIRADVYSLGGTLYYLLTGRPPFEANNVYDVYQAHISRDADPLNLVRPEVPAELAALVAKMMAKDPARRFQTPGEVAQALTPFVMKPGAAVANSRLDLTRAGSTNEGPRREAPMTGVSDSTRHDTQSECESKGPATECVVAAPRTGDASPRRSRAWLPVAVALLILGVMLVPLACGLFRFETPDGVIVLEGLPADAEVFANNDRITVRWPGGGKPAEIRVAPGERKLTVKKDGLTIYAQELTVKAGVSRGVTMRLEPQPPGRQPQRETERPTPVAANPPDPAARADVPAQGAQHSRASSETRPFNGKDFDGWSAISNGNSVEPAQVFRIAGQEWVWTGTQGQVWLDKPCENFALKFEFLHGALRWRGAGASVILAALEGEPFHVAGAEYEVGGVGFSLIDTEHFRLGFPIQVGDLIPGALVREQQGRFIAHRTSDRERPAGEWNEAELRCRDNVILGFLNGHEVSRLETDKKIVCRLGFASFGTEIRFRNIRMSSLPAGE